MRPAYCGLHKRGQINVQGRTPTVVCGRKFCPDCGRWRHLVDFPHRKDRPYSYCSVCAYRRIRALRTRDPDALERKREAGRFYYDRIARQRGITPRKWGRRSRRLVDIRTEFVWLRPGPLVTELRRQGVSIRTLSRRSGVPERSIDRLFRGESQHVRVDLADKLAVAVGIPLALLYGSDPGVIKGRAPRRAAA
jgi:hypothetical protein